MRGEELARVTVITGMMGPGIALSFALSGKGFYDWAQKDLEEVRRPRDQFIMARVKEPRTGKGADQS